MARTSATLTLAAVASTLAMVAASPVAQAAPAPATVGFTVHSNAAPDGASVALAGFSQLTRQGTYRVDGGYSAGEALTQVATG